jgi:competence protein ComEA
MNVFTNNSCGQLRTLMLASLLGTVLASSSVLAAEPLNINFADAKTLATTIDGVGLKRAEAIIEHRNMHGPFASVEALHKVPGIGMKTVSANKSKLTVRQDTRK